MLTLALGIGATTAMYSVVQVAVIRPVPYPEPDRVALVTERPDQGQKTRLTALDFVDVETHAQTFESIAAHTGTGFTFAGDGDAEMVLGQLTTAGLFDVLKTRPALGRSYNAGRESFEYPHPRYVLWTPLALSGTSADGPPINRAAHYIQAIARLKPGVTMAQAQRELDALSTRLAEAHPHRDFSLRVEPLADVVAASAKPALLLLLAGVWLLLIACHGPLAWLPIRTCAPRPPRSRDRAVMSDAGIATWQNLPFAHGGVGFIASAG